jgi:hypothetical protein
LLLPVGHVALPDVLDPLELFRGLEPPGDEDAIPLVLELKIAKALRIADRVLLPRTRPPFGTVMDSRLAGTVSSYVPSRSWTWIWSLAVPRQNLPTPVSAIKSMIAANSLRM